MKPTEYALYKGDQFIMIGTAEELAKAENVKPKTISFWNSPAYKRRIKDYTKAKLTIKLGD